MRKLSALFASVILASASVSQASSLGYTDYVTTAFGGNGQWSLWDVFPRGPMAFPGTYTLAPGTNLAGNSGTSGAQFTYTIAPVGSPGALIFPDGQGTDNSTMYTGGSAFTFTFSGIAVTAINNLFFQIKQDVDPDQGSSAGLEGMWSPVVNFAGGGGPASAVDADHGITFADGAADYAVTWWQFEDLGIGAGEAFSLTFSLAGGSGDVNHQNLDGFRVDADGSIGAVPEPSTYALMGIGAALVFWNVRRRRFAGSRQ